MLWGCRRSPNALITLVATVPTAAPATRALIRTRFIKEVRGDDPEVAAKLLIEERELEARGLN